MTTTYRVPCKITATNNDHLMIADLSVSETHATRLITGLRAIQDAKLHCLLLSDTHRDLPILAEGEEITIDFGGHQTAVITPEQLDTLEYFILDWLLGICKTTARCNLRLKGNDDLLVDLTCHVYDL